MSIRLKALYALLRILVYAAIAATPCALAQEKELERTGGPYVPTPGIVVDYMLGMADVRPEDFVVDLGSGDGIIVLTAVRERKARGIGVDIDPALVRRSNAEAKKLGIDDRAAFHVEDVFKTDLSRASVITLYLLPSMMTDLRSKIFLEARPGTRVVSHDYTFGEWKPDSQITLDVPEKELVNGVPLATISLWIVPAKVHGSWQLKVSDAEGYELALRQNYQAVGGSVSSAGRTGALQYVSLRGAEIRFVLAGDPAHRIFRGTVNADAMEGTVELGGRTARWSARRL